MNARKRQVLLIAQSLFINKGFSSTSIQDILEESNISKGTFYNYFTSKNECLMAILEHARDDANIRRREILIGQDIKDKSILAEQISVRMLVNREHNLLPIYEAVFYSGDKDLREFIRNHHLEELSWITTRLIDVYGDEVSPVASNCAVLLTGMMQHFLHFHTFNEKKEFDSKTLVLFSLRRIDAIIFDMLKTNDILINKDIFTNSSSKQHTVDELKEQLVTQLAGFLCYLEVDSRPNGAEYAKFLLEEIRNEQPRVFLLETVARSFREAFSGTRHEPEAVELISSLWRYIESLDKC